MSVCVGGFGDFEETINLTLKQGDLLPTFCVCVVLLFMKERAESQVAVVVVVVVVR